MAPEPVPAADPAADVGINMTPMIDVVFQLIVFLMLANDMGLREIEEVALPVAFHAAEDGATEARRILVNLLPGEEGPSAPPRLVVRGREMDLDAFRRLAEIEALAGPRDAATGASEVHALVRADARSRWQDVRLVVQALAEAGIRRLQFAARDPDRAGDGRRP